MARTKARYSGEESIDFWERVDGFKKAKHRDQAYTLGVILQNLEGDVLRALDAMEEKESKR